MPASRPLEPDFHDYTDGVWDGDVDSDSDVAGSVPPLSEEEERQMIDEIIRHDIYRMAVVFQGTDDWDNDDDDFDLQDDWPTLGDVFEDDDDDWESELTFDEPRDMPDRPDLSHYLY